MKKDGTNVLKATTIRYVELIDSKRKKIDRISVPKILLKEALIELVLESMSTVVNAYYENVGVVDQRKFLISKEE
ncbi:hypothetical protein ACLM5H_18220 [Fredinandcohnia humi]